MMGRFHYLGTGLALILLFIGGKMVLSGIVKVPALMSLGVIVCVLSIAVLASLLRPVRTPSAPDG
jgi:tellurite resistance protein TerC